MNNENVYKTFRKLISIFLLLICCSYGYSQIGFPKHLKQVFKPIEQMPLAILQNCTIPSLSGCNYVLNPSFQPSSIYDPNILLHNFDPFNFNSVNTLIPYWEVATGTPTVWNNSPIFQNYPPPPSGLNYFFGGTHYGTDIPTTPLHHMTESVVQKIPVLSTTKTYVLSFLKMYKSWLELSPPYNTDFPLYSFKIVLMHCSNYNATFLPLSYKVPDVPANSQTIYCEVDVHNPNWEQVFLKFTPNQNYDLMWIFPDGDHNYTDRSSGLLVTFPELIDVTNFSAGANPNPTPPSCNVTIGPSIPNCAPTGALFTWTGPRGQTPPLTPPSQQITIFAADPDNVGIWTLSMTMPNAVTTNSNGICSQQQDAQNPVLVSASVNVPFCNNPSCITPTITPLGPTTQCLWYETGEWLSLTTNLTSNIQWYDDGIPIYNGNTSTIILNNNPGSSNTWPTFTGHITVSNTAFPNCVSQPLTVTRKNHSSPYAYPGNPVSQGGTPLTYCKSQLGTIQQTQSISDPNTIYWWEVKDPFGNPATGVSITPQNTTNNLATISFSSYNHDNATIVAKSLDNTCSGNSNVNDYTYSVSINQSCLSFSNLISEKTDGIKFIMFPNPSNTKITISTNAAVLIQTIEINDFFSSIVKKINGGNTKSTSIDISDLKPGIYNCNITTDKTIEYQKFIIKR